MNSPWKTIFESGLKSSELPEVRLNEISNSPNAHSYHFAPQNCGAISEVIEAFPELAKFVAEVSEASVNEGQLREKLHQLSKGIQFCKHLMRGVTSSPRAGPDPSPDESDELVEKQLHNAVGSDDSLPQRHRHRAHSFPAPHWIDKHNTCPLKEGEPDRISTRKSAFTVGGILWMAGGLALLSCGISLAFIWQTLPGTHLLLTILCVAGAGGLVIGCLLWARGARSSFSGAELRGKNITRKGVGPGVFSSTPELSAGKTTRNSSRAYDSG